MSNNSGNTKWWRPSNEKFLKEYGIFVQREDAIAEKTAKISKTETASLNRQQEKEEVENSELKTNACEKINKFLETFFLLAGMISGPFAFVFSFAIPFIWLSEKPGWEKDIGEYLIYLLFSLPIFTISCCILERNISKGYIIKF